MSRRFRTTAIAVGVLALSLAGGSAFAAGQRDDGGNPVIDCVVEKGIDAKDAKSAYGPSPASTATEECTGGTAPRPAKPMPAPVVANLDAAQACMDNLGYSMTYKIAEDGESAEITFGSDDQLKPMFRTDYLSCQTAGRDAEDRARAEDK